MPIERIEIEPLLDVPIPEDVLRFIEDSESRVEAFLAENIDHRIPEFVPSDARVAYRAFRTIESRLGKRARICEWGSGFGTVAGVAALLGHESWGIELEARLVEASCRLLADHGIDAQIIRGSFLPDEYEEPIDSVDPEFMTILPGPAVYDEIELDPDDFDLFFSYPWPGSEVLFFDLFETYAAANALLLTYHGVEGVVLHAKTAAGDVSEEDEPEVEEPETDDRDEDDEDWEYDE